MALVEWADNIAISDDPPRRLLAGAAQRQATSPEFWTASDTGTPFLTTGNTWTTRLPRQPPQAHGAGRQGRLRKAQPARLRARLPAGGPSLPPAVTPASRTRGHYGVNVADLIAADLLPVGTTLLAVQRGTSTPSPPVLPRWQDRLPVDEIYTSPSAASGAAAGGSTNGWAFWMADTPDGQFTLAALRDEYLTQPGSNRVACDQQISDIGAAGASASPR